jgi:hypothetical protein
MDASSARELHSAPCTLNALERVVITVCSRCKHRISETFDKGSEKKVSHGICARCLAILEGEIQEGAKAAENGPKAQETPLHAEDP